MIIWLNGSFGSGKTTAAVKLHEKLEGSYIYDPENVGYFLWQNEPDEIKIKEDFQKEPLWRRFNYLMLKNICESFQGDVIVPMTLVNSDYYNEIIGALRSDGITVKHFVLYASKNTLLHRLSLRGDGADSWPAMQAERCITAYDSGCFEGIINTDDKTTDEILDIILEELK